MYKLQSMISDTDGQMECMNDVVEIMTTAYDMGYNWVSESAIERHLDGSKLKKHRSYVMRLMQDRGIVSGYKANRESDGKLISIWRLEGKHMPQYNSGEIPDSHVLD